MYLTWDINRLAPTTDAKKANPCDNELRISSNTKLPFVCTYIPLEVQEHSSALMERNPSAFRERSRNLMVVFWRSAFLNFSAPDSPKWLLERFRFRIDVFNLKLSHSCFEIGSVISAMYWKIGIDVVALLQAKVGNKLTDLPLQFHHRPGLYKINPHPRWQCSSSIWN